VFAPDPLAVRRECHPVLVAGGQIAAGFVIAGFYEDHWNEVATRLDRYLPPSMAMLALKPRAAIAEHPTTQSQVTDQPHH
jgi:hypothetical protein